MCTVTERWQQLTWFAATAVLFPWQVPDLINSPVPFSHLSFSNDGKSLLGVAEGKIFVLDAYVGSLKRSFSNGVTEAGAAPEASISYDGQYVLSGNASRLASVNFK